MVGWLLLWSVFGRLFCINDTAWGWRLLSGESGGFSWGDLLVRRRTLLLHGWSGGRVLEWQHRWCLVIKILLLCLLMLGFGWLWTGVPPWGSLLTPDIVGRCFLLILLLLLMMLSFLEVLGQLTLLFLDQRDFIFYFMLATQFKGLVRQISHSMR